MSIEVSDVETPVLPSPPSTEPKLVPVLSSRWVLRGEHLAITAVFCLLAVMLNHLPLRSTDLWGHVVFGQYLLDHRALPTQDPIQPLAEGMRVVDVHWLSQTIFAAVERWAGPQGLIGLFTLVVWMTYFVVARTAYLLTKSAWLSTLITVLVLVVGWNRVATIRPENFGMLLFAVLLWLFVGRNLRRADSILADDRRGDAVMWISIPLIACLWANMHGSFPICIGALGCFWFGRVIEVAWQERNFRAVLADREMRRRLYWLEIAFAATLINPYGIDAWIEAVTFSSNTNLRDILEWAPLVIVGPGGREFAVACVVLGVVCRHSRKAMAPADVLLLGLCGVAAAMQVRMTGWFAVVWGMTIAPHLADVVSQWLGTTKTNAAATSVEETVEEEIDVADARTPPLRYRYSLACLGVIWIAFTFTTFGHSLLGGEARDAESLYGANTPIRAVAWLKTQKLDGLAYNPQYWGDWIGWNAPPGLKPFATTNVHLMPRTVWNDYRRITQGDYGWDVVLDRYAVRTVLIDKQEQPTLMRNIRASADWSIVYEDDQAVIARRKSLLPPPTAAAPAAATPAPAATPTTTVPSPAVPTATASATKN